MKTIKKGDRGEAVRELQRLLCIGADGVFGPKTDAAVRAFQQQNGLVVDGIVGDKTMAALKAVTGKSVMVVADWVIYDPLKVHINYRPKRKIKYIVAHFVGSSHSRPGRARDTKHTFETREASADFCVDDRDVVQFNPDVANYSMWHCGGKKWRGSKGASMHGECTNANSIGIEICSTRSGGLSNQYNHDKWGFTDAALNNAAELAACLLIEYDLTPDCLIRHWDVNGKPCPGVWGWNDDPMYDSETGKQTGLWNNSEEWNKWVADVTERYYREKYG